MAEKKVLDDCKASVQATDDDVNGLLDRIIPKNHNGKCLLKCAYEKVGIVRILFWFSVFKKYGNWCICLFFQIANGQISIDNMKALGAQELGKNPKALGVLNEMIDECKSVADPDICEQSSKMMDCMIKAGIKRGIDPKKSIQESIGSL